MVLKISRIVSIVLIVVIILTTIITVYSISTETQRSLKGAVQEKLIAVASATASQIDGAAFARLQTGEENSPGFIHIRDQLYEVKQAIPDVRFIYTLRKSGDIAAFVVDADYGYDTEAATIGQAYPEAEPELFLGFIAPSADNEFTTDKWGTVLSGFAPIKDSTGNVVGIVGVDMDSSVVMAELNTLNLFLSLIGIIVMISAVIGFIVIEHRRSRDEQKIEESEKKYRLLFEQAGDGILLLEAEGENQGKIISANTAAAMMHGYTIDEILTKNIADLDNEFSRKPNPERFAQLIKTHSLKDEAIHVRKDGTEFPIEINAALLDLGIKKFVLAIDRDISERKKADDAIRQVTKKLTLLNAVTFNDIQNATFTLDAYIDLGKSFSDNEKVNQMLDKAEESARIINRSLNFAKNYQYLGVRPPRWHDVNQTFILGISHLDFSAIKRTVQLNNLEIYADSLFEQVFFSLANNVLRHAKTATRVTLGYQLIGDDLLLFFEDNGEGIQDVLKEKIFERGFGIQKGMDLFLLREILGITGITIRETGSFGSGARFEMIVPKGGYRFGEKA